MGTLTRWYGRLSAMVFGAVLGLLVPAVAWAQSDETAIAVADSLVKGKKAVKAAGAATVLAVLCCVVVVAIIVLAVLMIAKRRK